jgi:transmembrane sensor
MAVFALKSVSLPTLSKIKLSMSSSLPKRPPELHEAASRWVILHHSGRVTPAQQQDFTRWLNESENHRRAYREMEAFWLSLAPLQKAAAPELAAARAYLGRVQRRRKVFRSGLALAASLLLLAGIAPMYRIWLDNGIYRTAKGEHTHIELSDGTRIDVNTDSELRVAYTWSRRSVSLSRGEASFSVAHDAGKPFEVQAAGGLIRDIGTQFNVYRQKDRIVVTVLEGEVSVASGAGRKAQRLRPGMQLTYAGDGDMKLLDAVDTDSVTAWRKNRLVFKSTELGEVLEQLGRYHAVDLMLGDASLQRLKVSGSFSTGDLDLALNTIAAGLPVKVARLGAEQVVVVPLSGQPKRPMQALDSGSGVRVR